MKITNMNGQPYSLRLKNGKFEVLKPGETKDLDLSPENAENYARKGFTIEAKDAGSRRAKKDDASDDAKASVPADEDQPKAQILKG